MNKNKWFLNGGRGSGKTFRLLWETYENKIANLEKENAELKSNRDYWKGSSIYWHKQLKNKKYRKIAKATQQQLTKAKELLKQWLQTSKASGCDNINIVTDTEQFLSEVEKWRFI